MPDPKQDKNKNTNGQPKLQWQPGAIAVPAYKEQIELDVQTPLAKKYGILRGDHALGKPSYRVTMGERPRGEGFNAAFTQNVAATISVSGVANGKKYTLNIDKIQYDDKAKKYLLFSKEQLVARATENEWANIDARLWLQAHPEFVEANIDYADKLSKLDWETYRKLHPEKNKTSEENSNFFSKAKGAIGSFIQEWNTDKNKASLRYDKEQAKKSALAEVQMHYAHKLNEYKKGVHPGASDVITYNPYTESPVHVEVNLEAPMVKKQIEPEIKKASVAKSDAPAKTKEKKPKVPTPKPAAAPIPSEPVVAKTENLPEPKSYEITTRFIVPSDITVLRPDGSPIINKGSLDNSAHGKNAGGYKKSTADILRAKQNIYGVTVEDVSHFIKEIREKKYTVVDNQNNSISYNKLEKMPFKVVKDSTEIKTPSIQKPAAQQSSRDTGKDTGKN